MKYPALPAPFTAQTIKALSLRQFSVLLHQYGLFQIAERMGWGRLRRLLEPGMSQRHSGAISAQRNQDLKEFKCIPI